jgi:hypothetical protein
LPKIFKIISFLLPNFGDSGKLKYSPDYPFLFSGEVFFEIGSCRILGGDSENHARPWRFLGIKNVKIVFSAGVFPNWSVPPDGNRRGAFPSGEGARRLFRRSIPRVGIHCKLIAEEEGFATSDTGAAEIETPRFRNLLVGVALQLARGQVVSRGFTTLPSPQIVGSLRDFWAARHERRGNYSFRSL